MRTSFTWVGLTEQAVSHAPNGMEGWRCYLIEYGGFNDGCLCEGVIWLPRHADAAMVEVMLRGMIATENDTIYGDEVG